MLSQYKNYIKFFIGVLFILFTFKLTFASTLTLTKIGTLDLGGKTYKEWWYTGTNPTFYGAAAKDSTVSIKIAETAFTATADTVGNWSYAAKMEKGDYAIEISSGAEKLSFTLHLGQALPDSTSQTSGSATSTPSTGFNQFIGITFGIGIILLATYLYFSTGNKRKTIFENRMLKED